MDLVQAKEKPVKSTCWKTIMKLPFLNRCVALDTERGLYTEACDTQAQTRPVVGEVKLHHYISQPKKTHPISQRVGAQTSQTRFR